MTDPGPTENLAQLAEGLAHEIKNPLSTLTINLALLKEDLETAPASTSFRSRVELIEAEVKRLESLVADFLRYAGGAPLDLRPADLGALCAEVAEFLGPGLLQEGVALETSLGSFTADVDPPRFKQALLNVLLNARQALAEGGRIWLDLRNEADGAVVEVRDDGPGVPEDLRERVFEVYFSRSQQGTGLGLPTARRIVEAHGGSIGITEAPEGGACVRIVLGSERMPGTDA